ncbi:MAG TPA: DUF177 domain-containing protein [Pyrinomonadaceae bacterium]|nr:DUF177 domain-containing protein [Pyrinomonadaceae bacterium]
MLIEVENLTGAGRPFAKTYASGEVELDEEGARLASGAIVEGSARRKGDEVSLRGKISAVVEVSCDRCVADVRVPLEVEFDTAFIPRERAASEIENVELLTEDMGLAAYEGGAIDLDELVREQILLALPSRRICREDCKGLCPTCGTDLNAGACSCEQGEVDPRWSALADWNDKSREP